MMSREAEAAIGQGGSQAQRLLLSSTLDRWACKPDLFSRRRMSVVESSPGT